MLQKRGLSYHFKCSANDPAVDVGEPKLVLSFAVIWELHKVGERVLIYDQGKGLAVVGPIGDGGCDVEEDFETYLLPRQFRWSK